MIESNNPEINAEELMLRVQEELKYHDGALLKGMVSPVVLADAAHIPMRLRGRLPAGRSFALGEFLDFFDEPFVENAYWGILGREPDSHGKHVYLTGLRQGRYRRVDILGKLRFSREGLRRAVRVKGLLRRYLLSRLFRIPVLGYVFSIGWEVLRLPRISRDLRRMEALLHYQESQYREKFSALEAEINRPASKSKTSG